MKTRIGILLATLLILSGCMREKTVNEARTDCLSEASNAPTDAGVKQRVMLCYQKYPKQQTDWSKFTPVEQTQPTQAKPSQAKAPVDWSQFTPVGDDTVKPDRRPIIEDMHRVLEDAVSQWNAQRADTRVDDYTMLKAVTYDRSVPVFTYHYTTTWLEAGGKRQYSDAERRTLYEYNRAKTCNTQFVPFMRTAGLQVTHHIEDAATGKEMISITLRGSDCPAS